VPVLVLLAGFPRLRPRFLNSDPSGRTLAGEIIAQQIGLDQVYAANMRRGQHYSLNFYLHHEIQEWNAGDPKEGYLLLNAKNCRQEIPLPFTCSEEIEPGPSGWFIYQVKR
jgi:hypothetical protein